MKRTLSAAAALLAAASLPGYAQETTETAPAPGVLGELSYAGTGCPEGTVFSATSGDGQALAVLFTAYQASKQGAGITRLSCNLAVPVNVPTGMSVSILPLALAGSHDVVEGGSARIGIESFLPGAQGVMRDLTIAGPATGRFVLGEDVTEDELLWSACGEDVILRVNTSLLLTGAGPATVSIDVGLGYRLAWRSC